MIHRFTVVQDCRFRGKHTKAGSTIELDLEADPEKRTAAQLKDLITLGSLLNSGRLRETPFSESSPSEPKPAAKPEPKK